MRTNRGPVGVWKRRVGKGDGMCSVCGVIETGSHVVFECPVNAEARKEHLGNIFKSWKDMKVTTSESLGKIHKFFKVVESSRG